MCLFFPHFITFVWLCIQKCFLFLKVRQNMHVFLPVGIGVFTILLFSCYFLTVILIHGIYSVQFPHYRISPYHFLQYTLIRNQFIILNCCGQEKLPVIHTYITLSQLRACFKCPEIPALILNSCV